MTSTLIKLQRLEGRGDIFPLERDGKRLTKEEISQQAKGLSNLLFKSQDKVDLLLSVYWLEDEEYQVSYGDLLVRFARKGKLEFLEVMSEIDIDDKRLFCPVYILNRASNLSKEVKDFLLEDKRKIEKTNDEMLRKSGKEPSPSSLIDDEDEWYEEIGYHFGKYGMTYKF